MPSQVKHWWTNRQAMLFFISAVAIAFAMTACGKNKKDEDTAKTKTAATVPASTVAMNFNSLIDMATANSAEAAQLVKSTSRASITVEASVRWDIKTLVPEKLSNDGTVSLNIKLTAGGKSVTATVNSSRADLTVSGANSDLRISGYWTINGTSSMYPGYVGIDAQVKRNSVDANDGYSLVGQLYSNFDNNGTYETLLEINSNVCENIADASFIAYYTEDGAPDCRK